MQSGSPLQACWSWLNVSLESLQRQALCRVLEVQGGRESTLIPDLKPYGKGKPHLLVPSKSAGCHDEALEEVWHIPGDRNWRRGGTEKRKLSGASGQRRGWYQAGECARQQEKHMQRPCGRKKCLALKGPNEAVQLEPRAKRIEVQGEVREAPRSSCTLKSDPRYNSGDMMSPSTLKHAAPDFSLAFRKLNPNPASWSRGRSSGTHLVVLWGHAKCSSRTAWKVRETKGRWLWAWIRGGQITNEPQWKERGHEPPKL